MNPTYGRVTRRAALGALTVAALCAPQTVEAQAPVTLCASFDTSLCFEVQRPQVADFLQSITTAQLLPYRSFIDGILGSHNIGPIPDDWYSQQPPGPVFVLSPRNQLPPTSVPEPPIWLMTATGMLGLVFLGRRRRRET